MKRRNFLKQAAAVSLMPLARLDLFDFQRSIIVEAERLHNRVMAAFDFGASLPREPWLCNYWTSPFGQRDAELLCAHLQNIVPALRRGDYQIVTVWCEDGRIGAWIEPWREIKPIATRLANGGPPVYHNESRRKLP